MFVKVSFEVDLLHMSDLKYKLRMDNLPVDITSLINKSSDIEMQVYGYPGEEEYLSWKVELAKQPINASALAAGLRLVWRVRNWTAHFGAAKIVGANVYE